MQKRNPLCAVMLVSVFIGGLIFAQTNWPAPAKAQAGKSQKIADKTTALRKKLSSMRWVAYAPTNWNPEISPPIIPPNESIREDLRVLHEAGFDGLVTYGADLANIPQIAEQAGFRGLLQGVWDPNNRDEIERAKKIAAESTILVGIIVGNEGLMFHRYDLQSLRKAMDEMKRETGKPVSTTEVVESYFSRKELVEWSDFLAPNAHPYFHGRAMREPRRAVAWTLKVFQNLLEQARGKPVLLKEVGLPTSGDEGLSEKAQAEYYSLLKKTEVKFVYFEAFDSLFKAGAIEPHWGLFKADRTPKLVARAISGRGALRGH